MYLLILLFLLLLPTPAHAQHVSGPGITAKTCSSTDKFSAVSSAGVFTCSADQTGAGGGDAIQVEDADNAGTFTAATDADFEDSSDINFVLDTASSPDQISATIRANSVALSTDTTGNYVLDVADGTGIDGTAAAEGATYTPSLDLTEITCGAGVACGAATTITAASSEADFLTSGALVCGAGTQGKAQVHTTPLQYCDNAATPALQYAAYGNTTGESTAAANNSVALSTDTTGNYVLDVADGTGIDGTAAAEGATYTPSLDLTEITCGAGVACGAATTITAASSEADFLTSGALVCGAGTQGKAQVHTTPFQYCDNAATPALQYAAYGNSTGESTTAANNSVALSTDTTGNYVLDVADGTGIDGTAAAEGATYTPSLDLTEITCGTGLACSAATTIDLDYADTLAGNPTFNAEECVFTTDGTGGGGFLCEGNTGGNTNEQLHLFAAADGADTTDFIATASAAVTDAIGAATTNTLTNKTLDVEGTGNSLTTVSKLWLPVAQCQNATAGILWDYETTNSPAAACITGTNTQKGVADFDATTDECLQYTVQLPADWTGNIDVRYVWYAAATTGAAGWCSQLVSTADAETDDPAFPAQGAGNCVSDTAKGTTNQVNQADDTSITATGVAAGELLHIRLCRDANGGAVTDDMTGDARLIGVEYTFRRAQ